MNRQIWNDLADEEIIKQLTNEGNTDAFNVLYKRYKTRIYNKCYSIVLDRESARNLSEEVFTKAYLKLHSFKQESKFSTWLYAITYNHCIDHLREKKKMHYPNWNNNHELPEIVDESEELVSEITYENLVHILDLIHPEEKALLLMKYQENLSINDISSALRISTNATKMRLKRARARVFYLYKQKYLTSS